MFNFDIYFNDEFKSILVVGLTEENELKTIKKIIVNVSFLAMKEWNLDEFKMNFEVKKKKKLIYLLR